MVGWHLLVVAALYAAAYLPVLLELLDRSLDEPELDCPHCGHHGRVRRNCRWERREHRSLVCYRCRTAWFENPATPVTVAR